MADVSKKTLRHWVRDVSCMFLGPKFLWSEVARNPVWIGKKIESISNKPVGDWISAPSSNFVAMATRVGPQHFACYSQKTALIAILYATFNGNYHIIGTRAKT